MPRGVRPVLSDEDFIQMFREIGPAAMADKFNLRVRGIYARRQGLERRRKIVIKGPDDRTRTELEEHPARLQLDLKNGTILIGSDSHYWPGIISTAHRAFVYINRALKPDVVVKNGDELDFPGISRHPPIGWEKRPAVVQEIEAAQERLAEIEDANKNAKYYWPLGNHDSRYETRLATVAPEYARVHGVHLKDHFPRWKPCWSLFVNDDLVIKHRPQKGGVNAPKNSTIHAGRSTVHGHLHSLNVSAFSDYDGTRWGVDCGTMADPYGSQFVDYTEDSSKDWRSGFALLTIHDGELIWPELVHVKNESRGEITFRGKVLTV